MIELTWTDFDVAVAKLARCVPRRCVGLYGVPRGGLPLAVALSHRTGAPLLSEPAPGAVLVEDMADTGRTLAALRDAHGPLVALAWVVRHTAVGDVRGALIVQSDEWVLFPWERASNAAADAAAYRARSAS